MKRTLLIAVLLIAAIVLSGCSLIQGIFFGEDEPRDLFYGLEEVEIDLYATDWENDRIVSVGGENIPTGEKPHGFAWDQESNTDPDFWVADVNEGEVYKVNGDESVAMGADIVSVETGGGKIFVADRLNDEIHVYELNSGSFTTGNHIETIDLDLNSSVGVGYIDMFYHTDGTSEFLYVVSDEMKDDDFGFLRINLANLEVENTDCVIEHFTFNSVSYDETGEKDFGALGIVYDEVRDVVFVNTGGRIIAFDDTGESVIADLHEDAAMDFNGAYIDLVLSDTPYDDSEQSRRLDPAVYLYVASGLDVWQNVEDDTPHHILRYRFDGDSLVYDGTIVL